MKKTNFQKVQDFHYAFQVLPTAFTDGLRLKLIMEEAGEVAEASANFISTQLPSTEGELIKELCDLLYVTYGYLDLLGIDADKAFNLVHESNMSKLDENGDPIFREDGKVLKGPNYKPVDPVELYRKTRGTKDRATHETTSIDGQFDLFTGTTQQI